MHLLLFINEKNLGIYLLLFIFHYLHNCYLFINEKSSKKRKYLSRPIGIGRPGLQFNRGRVEFILLLYLNNCLILSKKNILELATFNTFEIFREVFNGILLLSKKNIFRNVQELFDIT